MLVLSIEFFLVNDSYSNKRHWAPPKGKVIGNEDPLKCAIRETADITGVSAKSFSVEDSSIFRVEIKYLSGTTPKHVVYYLGCISSRERIAPGGMAGLNAAWFPLAQAQDKCFYKNMQEVLRQALLQVEIIRARAPPSPPLSAFSGGNGSAAANGRANSGEVRRVTSRGGMAGMPGATRSAGGAADGSGKSSDSTILSPRGSLSGARRNQSSTQQPLVLAPNGSSARGWRSSRTNEVEGEERSGQNVKKSTALTESPLYKTRLCERFETEGDCCYGPRCTFAHGAGELRDRSTFIGISANPEGPGASVEATSRIIPTNESAPSVDPAALYKTRMCEKWQRDGFCQYGPRCNFAHSPSELRERVVTAPSARAAVSGAVREVEGVIVSAALSLKTPNSRSSGISGTGANAALPSGPAAKSVLARIGISATVSNGGKVPSSKSSSGAGFTHAKNKESTQKENVVSFKNFLNNRDKTSGTKKGLVIAASNLSASEKDLFRVPDLISVTEDETVVDNEDLQDARLSGEHSEGSEPDKNEVSDSESGSDGGVDSDDEDVDAPAILPPFANKSEEVVYAALSAYFSARTPSTVQADVKQVTRLEFKHDLPKPSLFAVLVPSLFPVSLSVLSLLEEIERRAELVKAFVRSNGDEVLLLRTFGRILKSCRAWKAGAENIWRALCEAKVVTLAVAIDWVRESSGMDGSESFLEWAETLTIK
ncbi:hypothetical protein DFJ73DRAFT_380062 [Zopfochytrium polystomum]|nr:hypothetical protein DFJ73DRAFT_380062 [Zopfochytrium polystomum]